MDSTLLLIAGVVVVAVFAIKRAFFVSSDVALKHLRNGALLVDVRTVEEYRSGHLAGAVNIPLDTLRQVLPHRVKDKRQAVLLHCLSGTRSGMARRWLKTMGYENVFNLGSFGRAEQIVKQAKP